MSEQRQLYAYVRRICEETEFAMPDLILLHSQADFLAAQSRRLKVLNGFAPGRVLCLGLPLLYLLNRQELRSVIVHELAHLSGNDIRYLKSVSPVYWGTRRALEFISLRKKNLLVWAIADITLVFPEFLIQRYWDFFSRNHVTVLRSKEMQADWAGATHGGREAYASSLVKLYRWKAIFNGILFPESADEPDHENVYVLLRDSLPELEATARVIEAKALQAKDSPLDPYPSLRMRIDSLPDIVAENVDDGPAIELIANPETYELEFTRLLKARKILCEGPRFAMDEAWIPAPAPADAEAPVPEEFETS